MFPISNLATVTNGGRDLGSVNWKIRSPNLVELLSPLSLLKSGLVCITDGHKNGLWLGVERFLACKDATKNYFHHQLICWLISWLNDTTRNLVCKMAKKKKKIQFLEAKRDKFNFLVLSHQQSKAQRYSDYYPTRQRKAANPHTWEAGTWYSSTL